MKCNQCGAEISSNIKFCTKCGAELSENSQPPKKKLKKGMLLVLIIIFIALLFWLGMGLTRWLWSAPSSDKMLIMEEVE